MEYLDNFFDNEPIMSVDNERKIIQLLSTQMPIMAFNSVISKLITPDNRVAMVTIPDKEGYYLDCIYHQLSMFRHELRQRKVFHRI